jgi:hypothetical protein
LKINNQKRIELLFLRFQSLKNEVAHPDRVLAAPVLRHPAAVVVWAGVDLMNLIFDQNFCMTNLYFRFGDKISSKHKNCI